jgi:ADP-heptose:LPS heptosyltransferase
MAAMPDATLPERILVVRLGAIGDVVNALVLAAALQETRPGLHVGWAVHPLAAPLVSGHPCVQRVHVWKRGGGLAELRRLVGELRAERYGLALDLQRIQKSALLARLSGAPRVLGFERTRVKELSWIWTRERIPMAATSRHMLEQYLDAARHLGCAASAPRRLVPRDAAAEAWAAELVAELGAAPVVLVLGASKPPNRWAPARFGSLARALAGELPVVLVGGPDDRAAAATARAEAGSGVRDLVGATTLLQLAELARRARLVVSCDTGPMHLAAAVETPVVALFGPADPARTGPYGHGHRVVRAPEGAMERLEVASVLEIVRAALASPRDRQAPAWPPEGAREVRRARLEPGGPGGSG